MNIMLILNFVGVIMILLAILLQLPWRRWLEKKFGDNPGLARVYVQYINKYMPVDGKLIKTKDGCARYEYKWLNKNRTLVVPGNYPLIYVRGRRYLHVLAGELIASLPGKANEDNFDQEEYDTLVRSGIAVEVVNSLTGKKAPSWIIIVLVICIAVAGYFVYQNLIKESAPAIPSSENTSQQLPIGVVE